jgi:DNA mismatch repair ATPase MutL
MTTAFKVIPPPTKYLPIADRQEMPADGVIVGWDSVVEELVLNAVDAGARNVKIWYDCESWRCEVADDGHGISPQELNFVGQMGWTSRHGIRPSAKHGFGHLGQSLALISAVSDVTIISSITEGVSNSKTIGDPSEVHFCDGVQLLKPGTRVICSNMFESRPYYRKHQQNNFRIQHSRLVRFLGMIRLKHFGLQIEVHATAPIHDHADISTFKLTFASHSNSLRVFAELSAANVESCQHAKIETNGILFELFWTFQTSKSSDFKRSSPEREMFNLLFNGAIIQPLDCTAYDEIEAIVTRSLNGARSRKRPVDTEEIFVQATVCISCTWDDTCKRRGIYVQRSF